MWILNFAGVGGACCCWGGAEEQDVCVLHLLCRLAGAWLSA